MRFLSRRVIAATISTIRRAVRFRGVSSAQSTWSVPADGWHPTQSEPTAADMMPMVSMKSSTPMPLSAWTFLKTSSAIFGFAGAAAWPPCADMRVVPITVATRMVTAPAIALDPTLM